MGGEFNDTLIVFVAQKYQAMANSLNLSPRAFLLAAIAAQHQQITDYLDARLEA